MARGSTSANENLPCLTNLFAISLKPFQKQPISNLFLLKKVDIALIDLSHTIEDGMITYKGLPAPIICDYLSRERSRGIYEAGTEFQIGKIEMVTNTGTYVDCPFHRYSDGKDLSEVKLEKFAN